MSVPRELLELAEHSNTFTPLGVGERRVEDPRFVVWLGPSRSPWATVVQRLRLGDDVDAAVAEIRDLLHRLDRPRRCQWEVSGSRTPADLHARLLALGFEPDPEPEVVGMVLTDEPPPVPAAVTVRRVETLADYAASQEIARVAFGVPEEQRAVNRPQVLPGGLAGQVGRLAGVRPQCRPLGVQMAVGGHRDRAAPGDQLAGRPAQQAEL